MDTVADAPPGFGDSQFLAAPSASSASTLKDPNAKDGSSLASGGSAAYAGPLPGAAPARDDRQRWQVRGVIATWPGAQPLPGPCAGLPAAPGLGRACPWSTGRVRACCFSASQVVQMRKAVNWAMVIITFFFVSVGVFGYLVGACFHAFQALCLCLCTCTCAADPWPWPRSPQAFGDVPCGTGGNVLTCYSSPRWLLIAANTMVGWIHRRSLGLGWPCGGMRTTPRLGAPPPSGWLAPLPLCPPQPRSIVPVPLPLQVLIHIFPAYQARRCCQ